jgi:hypothetical protein
MNGITPRTRKRLSWRMRLTRLAVVALGALALGAQPASALTYQWRDGTREVRGYVTPPGTMFGCSPGHVYIAPYTVRAPSDSPGVRVYLTYTIRRFNGLTWVDANNTGTQTAFPGGKWLFAGESVTVPRVDDPTPAAGWYYAYTTVDYRYYGSALSGAWVSAFYMEPNYASDWSAQYTYQGSGESYCWHS